ncbi:phenylalanine--tRNA ligase subunit beta [Neoactinobaculum massilliense]|uniref:phenylalanine--tRNA ligase subunit beta n=1 Tax=Neoactinobaculum massilliense TaxID=2364794 RepID=UPI000F53A64E|nr:phenylalanine--tRNA ligase subunit beta [Neoactinobaculum massilliense]
MPLIPIDWLSDHVETPVDLTPEQLAKDLVRVGLEEEAIHDAEVTGPVVVGRVLTRDAKEQHNGKVINYCRVDVGAFNDAPGEGKEPSELPSRGIICGAHNFEVGDYVVASLPGAVLPGDFAIAARKTYGHLSDGMLCSARELGLGEDHDGIIILAHSAEEAADKGVPAVGEDVLSYLGFGGRTLEINITPDRGYCFSMRGVAREFHHSTGAAFTDRALEENLPEPLPEVKNGFPVVVEDSAPIHGVAGVDLYTTRIVRGVDSSATSPDWMQRRLKEAGMRPISLTVDVSNYVMLDLGLPSHTFDLAKVVAPIVVRRAKDGETLTTLDGVTRELSTEDLVISDSKGGHGARVLGLAGVMGGESTEITETTRDVLIEVAHFDPVTIARTARRHRLPSEASKRFERGVDPAAARVAGQRIVDLLVQYGGGEAGPEVGQYGTVAEPAAITFAPAEVERLTGLRVDAQRIRGILEDIGCTVSGSDPMTVTPPTWRPDLNIPADLVEEVARIEGYDAIPSVVPAARPGHGLTRLQRQRRDIQRALADAGWVQVLSYPFMSESEFDAELIPADDPRRTALRLVNPLQDEAPLMRTSLLDTLLKTARLNVARQNPAVALFETGLVTRPAGITAAVIPEAGQRPDDTELDALARAVPHQPHHVAGVAVGAKSEPQAGFEPESWDWRDAVSAALSVAAVTYADASVHAASHAPFHPGRCAEITVGSTVVGYAGELHPSVVAAFELLERAVAFEVDTDALAAASPAQALQVAPVYTAPPAKEDLAFDVPANAPAGEVEAVIREAAGARLESLTLFDVYTGDQIEDGHKSLAFSIRLRGEQTLKADDVAGLRKRIVKRVRKRFGGELRA